MILPEQIVSCVSPPLLASPAVEPRSLLLGPDKEVFVTVGTFQIIPRLGQGRQQEVVTDD